MCSNRDSSIGPVEGTETGRAGRVLTRPFERARQGQGGSKRLYTAAEYVSTTRWVAGASGHLFGTDAATGRDVIPFGIEPGNARG
ncbi:hypothetical protein CHINAEXTREME_09260 [Halobiforma lacisalsi AJ5]|uniref:Uncharacterized protein n=1 Tax=Natronobacterium lacisalsi AJ5 TaxID=358396 RepID=M0L5Z6_NATLA|nr:hypothetical protein CHINAEXTREME_09260 [Halobiforma lacisalsi AJ5]EMA28508.1 hypothetical protein C445_17826 [Halobiforma lacisalsi AJ5]